MSLDLGNLRLDLTGDWDSNSCGPDPEVAAVTNLRQRTRRCGKQ